MEKCIMCDQEAVWERCTQFAGDHPFCQKHAEAEPGFMTNDSYEFWREIKKEQVMEKIEGTAENWDNRVLGADARYARRVSPEQEQELDMIVKSWSNPDDEELLEQLYWEFDSERKTGEERLKFKSKLRFYAFHTSKYK